MISGFFRFLRSVSRRSIRRRRRHYPACAEILERRVLLAVITWSGDDGTTDFEAGENWQGGVAPIPTDAAVFKDVGSNNVADVTTTRTVNGIIARGNADFYLNVDTGATLTSTVELVAGSKPPAGETGSPYGKLTIDNVADVGEADGEVVVEDQVVVGGYGSGELVLLNVPVTAKRLYVGSREWIPGAPLPPTSGTGN